ncbi:hypothetical protein D3C71_1820520 [compost metagenome]
MLPNSSVYPSASAFATYFVPMAPDAPALLSTMTVARSCSCRPLATRRACTSVLPPGGKGTTRVMGLLGYSCAEVVSASRANVVEMTICLPERKYLRWINACLLSCVDVMPAKNVDELAAFVVPDFRRSNAGG